MRLRGLIRKEFLQAFRDPSSLGIAFVLPVVLLLLFGYGVSLDADHVPLALVVEKPTPDTAGLCGAFEQSRYFEPVYLHGMHAALQALAAHRINAIVHLREDFSRRLRSPGKAAIQLIVNGVDANTARIIEGYVEGVYGNWLEDYAVSKGPVTEHPGAYRAARLVQQQSSQPQFSGARIGGGYHDPDRRAVNRSADGSGVGTRHHGGPDGHSRHHT